MSTPQIGNKINYVSRNYYFLVHGGFIYVEYSQVEQTIQIISDVITV